MAARQKLRKPRRRTLTRHSLDAVILVSIGVVAAAIAAATYVQLGFAGWVALVAAIAVFTGLALLHVLVSRSERLIDLDREVEALREEVARLQEAESARAGSGAAAGVEALLPDRPEHGPVAPAAPTSPTVHVSRAAVAPADTMTYTVYPPGAAPYIERPGPAAGTRSGATPPPLPPAPGGAAPLSNRDPFAMRPSAEHALFPNARFVRPDAGHAPALPDLPPWPRMDAADAPAPGRPVASAASAPPREADIETFEQLQSIIKQLAEDVGGSRAATNPRVFPAPEDNRDADRLIDASASAIGKARTLFADEDDLAPRAREPEIEPVAPAAAIARSKPAAPMPPVRVRRPVDPAFAKTVLDAVAKERIEVLLEPIQLLSERRARHYEVSVRLRDDMGGPLPREAVVDALEELRLSAHLDALKLPRIARVARRVGERGRTASVLAEITGGALVDDTFLDAVATELGDGSPALVLSFAQDDCARFGPGHFETLTTMRDIGLAFAIEGVTHLDMDFGMLRARGFQFVKLDAEVFMNGLMSGETKVPAGDICRHFADLGLDLIVGRIGGEEQLARVVGHGAALGQGDVFGAPRAVKPEVVMPARTAA
jgi:cyclic-di-GMP phosphodiesterase TipF (flagellum assembly factor)